MSQKNTRIDQLLQFLKEDPADPFIHFALARESEKIGEDDKALSYYTHLVEKHPAYVGTYYHYGKLIQRRGDVEQARSIFKEGIIQARNVGDHLSASELEGALELLE